MLSECLTFERIAKPASSVFVDNGVVQILAFNDTHLIQVKSNSGDVDFVLELEHPFSPPIFLGKFPLRVIKANKDEIQFLFERDTRSYLLTLKYLGVRSSQKVFGATFYQL